MKAIKKLFPVLLSVVLGVSMVGCSEKHVHTYADQYTAAGESGHYKMATCEGHTDQHTELEAHSYDSDYVCTVCHYTHTHTWSSTYIDAGDNGHYTTSTCAGHAAVNSAIEAHVYDDDEDTTCNTCGHVRTIVSTTPSVPLSSENKIYVVGDSTVCSFSDYYYLPRYGYGTQLAEYLNVTDSQIVNLAISGRSSKSFLTEANYTTLTSSIGEGDYLIIGFGHNDEKSEEDARYTDATADYLTATTANGDSFQYILYNSYVKMATDKGATAILCTPVTRYDSTGSYTGSKVHDTTASDKLGKGGDYSQAIRDLGEATGTTVVDLTALTVAEYKKDNAAAAYYHAHTSYEGDPVDSLTGNETPSGRDDTHLNMFGAKMVAYQFANALKSTDCPLKANVRDDISAPTKEKDYPAAVKMDYIKPDYTPFDPENTTAVNLTGDWYATAMGKCGGDSKISSLTATYSDGVFVVGDTGGLAGSKFESGADGFAAAFMQIDVTKNFSASATVTVQSVSSALTNAQGGFGMMLRDDILINKNDDTLASNFVAAGRLNTKSPIFYRQDGTLVYSGSDDAIVANETHTLAITRVGQTVTVTLDGTQKTFTDFDFVARDNAYMYLCLFANRGVVAQFSNVQFAITGESQGA